MRLFDRITLATLTRKQGAIIIAALSLTVYAPSLFNLFAYDDVAVIALDKRIHSLSILRSIFAINYWNNESFGLYRPLVTGSFAVDWAIASNHPGWYHFVNLIWNAAACALAFLVIAELFPIGAAFAGALLFALHPVHVEAVANVVGRAEAMAATFLFGAALLWMRSKSRVVLMAAVPALYALALMSKESAIMLAPLVVLLDIASGRLARASFREWLSDRAAPMMMLALTACAFLLLRASAIHTLTPTALDAALEVVPHGMPRLLTALQVWPVYLRLFFLPLTLLSDYGPRVLMPVRSVTPLAAAGAIVVTALIGGGLIALIQGHRRTALTLLWVPVAILPVSNLLFSIGVLVAERTLYVPSFAVALLVAGAVAAVNARSSHGRSATIAVALIAVLFTVRTLIRIPAWKTTASVFAAQLRDEPETFRAAWHYARRHVSAKRKDEAVAAYAHAVDLWPHRRPLLREAQKYAATAGNRAVAERIAIQAVEAWPEEVEFRVMLARAALANGDSATARINVQRGLELAPADTTLRAMSSAVRAR